MFDGGDYESDADVIRNVSRGLEIFQRQLSALAGTCNGLNALFYRLEHGPPQMHSEEKSDGAVAGDPPAETERAPGLQFGTGQPAEPASSGQADVGPDLAEQPGPVQDKAAEPVSAAAPVPVAPSTPPRRPPNQPPTCVCSGRNSICSLPCLTTRLLQASERTLPENGHWRCARCRIDCPSALELESHFNGRRHLEVLAGERWWCTNCARYVLQSLEVHNAGKRHQFRLKPFFM